MAKTGKPCSSTRHAHSGKPDSHQLQTLRLGAHSLLLQRRSANVGRASPHRQSSTVSDPLLQRCTASWLQPGWQTPCTPSSSVHCTHCPRATDLVTSQALHIASTAPCALWPCACRTLWGPHGSELCSGAAKFPPAGGAGEGREGHRRWHRQLRHGGRGRHAGAPRTGAGVHACACSRTERF